MDKSEKGMNMRLRKNVAAMVLTAGLVAACDNGGAPATPPENQANEETPDVASPDLPDTDIYLGDVVFEDGGVRVENLRAVVAEKGYANQPTFEAGGATFLFTRQLANGKTDIWRYDIASGESAAVTDSSDRSEFSAKPAPMGGVSHIQERPDGEMTRVYRDGAPVVDLQPLGYYAWLDGGAALGVFYRSEPPQLRIVDVEGGENRTIAGSIGRSLQASPSGDALYFTSTEDDANRLYRLTSGAEAGEAVLDMPGAGEDYRLIFNGEGAPSGIFAADGDSLVYRALQAGDANEWRVAYDASAQGTLSRIAISDDHTQIALVLEPGE